MARKRIFISRQKNKAAQELETARNEIQNMRLLVHPHIVQILGSYEEGAGTRNHTVCTLMYPVGDNDLKFFLYEECKEDLSKSKWIGNWFVCLASALAYMHSQNIHHEDIKPSNIVHHGRHIYFTDFGSSRKFEAGEDTSTENPARATRLFAAPEALRTDENWELRHGSKTDVFSLGLVFFEMLLVYNTLDVIVERDRLFNNCAERRYYRVVEHISSVIGAVIFVPERIQNCVRNMLHMERATRPSASEVEFEFGDPRCGWGNHCSWMETSWDRSGVDDVGGGERRSWAQHQYFALQMQQLTRLS